MRKALQWFKSVPEEPLEGASSLFSSDPNNDASTLIFPFRIPMISSTRPSYVKGVTKGEVRSISLSRLYDNYQIQRKKTA